MGTVCSCVEDDGGAVVELKTGDETPPVGKTLLETPAAPQASKPGRKSMVLEHISKTRGLAGALATAEGQREFKALFDRLDKDADGFVSLEEWVALLYKEERVVKRFLGDASIQEIREAFRQIDKDHNGTVNFEELVRASEVFTVSAKTGAALQTEEGRKFFCNLFNQLDNGKDGQITYQEFVRAMCKHGLEMQKLLGVQKLSQETLRQAFERIDKDGSQVITWDEFMASAITHLDDRMFQSQVGCQ
eukprot:TRINITY_DN79409_c0_g1_i1.p1 TRINITY_DN79409_c0_g1~~TRINITY_DN79409_c0_g1_i1.p1  ORF type:complete len:247 (+),score=62.49 TRINITY_DN79409_c0_g1_i1:38-778(+)